MNKKNLASATASTKQEAEITETTPQPRNFNINDYKAAIFDIDNEIVRLQNAKQQILAKIQELAQVPKSV